MRPALTVAAEVREKYAKDDQRGYEKGKDNGPDDGRGIGGSGHVGVNEVGKLVIGNGFIGQLAEVGKVGSELLDLAIKVGRRGEEAGGEVLGGEVPGKNQGVKGNLAVAVGGSGGINEVDGAEGWEVNVGNIDELLLEVGAVSALDLGEKWGRRVDNMLGSQDSVSCFLEGAGFKTAMKVDTKFVLNEEGTEAGAGEVFA